VNITENALPSWFAKGKGVIYFAGIGGSGMYGCARLALHLGFRVSGSDGRESQNLSTLRKMKIPLFAESAPLPEDTFLVVYSFAIPPSHPRLVEAEAKGIRAIDRASFLGLLMRCFPVRAAVAGSHGKSSTTAMCAEILTRAGRSPTVVSGASLGIGEDSFKAGEGDVLLFEACEYKDAFLSFSPTHALVLDASWEHTDYFPDKTAVMRSFSRFLRLESVTCAVAPKGLFSADVTFGTDGDYRAECRFETREGTRFLLCRQKEALGLVKLSVLGAYQVENALGAAALCASLGVSDRDIVEGLCAFRGISRRMEKRGYLRGVPLYLDFAHHPKELISAIKTASRFARPLALVFEPHTYSRTKSFFEEYLYALRLPHLAGVLPIYAAREEKDESVSSELLAKRAGIAYLPDYRHAARFLTDAAGRGCILLLAGAGGVEGVLDWLQLFGSR